MGKKKCAVCGQGCETNIKSGNKDFCCVGHKLHFEDLKKRLQQEKKAQDQKKADLKAEAKRAKIFISTFYICFTTLATNSTFLFTHRLQIR